MHPSFELRQLLVARLTFADRGADGSYDFTALFPGNRRIFVRAGSPGFDPAYEGQDWVVTITARQVEWERLYEAELTRKATEDDRTTLICSVPPPTDRRQRTPRRRSKSLRLWRLTFNELTEGEGIHAVLGTRKFLPAWRWKPGPALGERHLVCEVSRDNGKISYVVRADEFVSERFIYPPWVMDLEFTSTDHRGLRGTWNDYIVRPHPEVWTTELPAVNTKVKVEFLGIVIEEVKLIFVNKA